MEQIEAAQERKAEDDIEKQICPFCHEKFLLLTEREMDIPYFGKVFLFSMTCANCRYHKADVEAAEQKEPKKYTIDITSEKDMSVRIVKSSEATVKIPYVVEITPGPASQGYVTNVEGILKRVKSSFKKILTWQK